MNGTKSAGIGELDLLAYADGHLDRDPGRREAVEAHLRANPGDAARVDAYVAQNEAIRATYAEAAEGAVPERLVRVLERGARPWTGAALRAAAAAAALIVAAGAGWLVGRSEREPPLLAQTFVEQTMLGHLDQPGTLAASDSAGTPGAAQPMVWLSERISPELQPPDLSALGLRRIDVRMVQGGGPNAVRVTYADGADRRISLFLKMRWDEAASALRFSERDGVSMAYWLDGPLVYGLAGPVGREMLAQIADHIRRVSRANAERPGPPAVQHPVVEPRDTVPAAAGASDGPIPELSTPLEPQAGGGTGGPTRERPVPAPGTFE